MISRTKKFLSDAMLYPAVILARGGGGGSGGGGGGGGGFGGGGFSSSRHYSSSGSGNFSPWFLLFPLAIFTFFGIMVFLAFKKQRAREQKKQAQIAQKENIDIGPLKTKVEELFYKFQEAWAQFDLAALQAILTKEYYPRIALELGVLKNERRANLMTDLKLYDATIVGEELDEDNATELVMKISASAHDTLMDTEKNQELFADDSSFTEYWHLEKHEGVWQLDLITQETEDPALVESEIATFAAANGFYFDPDFGWLMMPNQGVLFSQSDFDLSDINNHVIGYFRGKIVEFYTYIPKPNGENYLIAQAVLPISYKNILVKKKGLLNTGPAKLKQVELESADFNKKFSVWADPQDQVNSLELLTPNFMEKIYALPFDLNIELVGNFLYFYTQARGSANYPKMLEILSWAFDEMKM